MEAIEINRKKINQYAAKSAHIYFDYLSENKRFKGVSRVSVRSFKQGTPNNTYTFSLAKTIREDSIEYVIFEIDSIIYQTNDIQITNYNEDARLLTVKIVGQELLKRFLKKKS